MSENVAPTESRVVDKCGDELIFEEDHSGEDNMFAGQCTIE